MIHVRLKELLHTRGRTRYWLAKQARMTYPAITNIYNGDTESIEFSKLDAICEALDCQPGDVLVRVRHAEKEDKQ